jgi:uncharacterized protein
MRILLAAIDAYRTFVRPVLPQRCRFSPSCADYAHEAVELRGLRGAGLAALRVLRCHPLHPGGYDPVPR